MSLISKLLHFGDKTAIVWAENNRQIILTYQELFNQSKRKANYLHAVLPPSERKSIVCSSPQRDCKSYGRVALLDVGQGHYVSSLLGTWMAGFASVPLCTTHPESEWKYFVEDSKCDLAFYHSSYADTFGKYIDSQKIKGVFTDKEVDYYPDFTVDYAPKLNGHSLTIYTSGTTGRPKGVVHSHFSIESSLKGLHQAWEWSRDDYILNFLPLHHVHGLCNVVLGSLYAGATVELLDRFNATVIWNKLISNEKISIFMAVPTIYAKLIKEYECADKLTQLKMTEACKRLRLMVSGSMALPVPILKRWEEISGHVLLERYGMTEIAMGLSNPLHGQRVPGFVGTPLPGVAAKINAPMGEPGELLIKSDNMFCGYWNRPEATQKEFDEDGWFKTGDIALNMKGNYKILGRSSVDILKVGGYKISALDIERVFLSHPNISECAVIGIPDDEYGQRIGMIASFKSTDETSLPELQQWAKNYLPPYQIPTRLLVTNEIPKNAMGKVNKKTLVSCFA